MRLVVGRLTFVALAFAADPGMRTVIVTPLAQGATSSAVAMVPGTGRTSSTGVPAAAAPGTSSTGGGNVYEPHR